MIDDHVFRSELANELLAVNEFDRVNTDKMSLVVVGGFRCSRGLRLQQHNDLGNLFLVFLCCNYDEQAPPRIVSEASVGVLMVDDQEKRSQDCNGGLTVRVFDPVTFDNRI